MKSFLTALSLFLFACSQPVDSIEDDYEGITIDYKANSLSELSYDSAVIRRTVPWAGFCHIDIVIKNNVHYGVVPAPRGSTGIYMIMLSKLYDEVDYGMITYELNNALYKSKL